MTETTQVVIVGAGPAGIAAACTAAENGKRVALIDDNPAPGGQIWRSAHYPSATHSSGLQAQWFRRLRQCASVEVYFGCRVFDAPSSGLLLTEQEGRLIEFRYTDLVLATGARELFLPFPGWTLPGVFGAGGLQALVKSGLPVSGKRIVVAGSGPLLLAVAACLRGYGARISTICEQASWGRLARFGVHIAGTTRALQGLGYGWHTLGIPFRAGCWPVSAQGDGKLESVTLTNGARKWEIACDYLACGFHLVPNTELAMLLGCTLRNGFVEVNTLQQTSRPGVYCAGEPTGIGGLELALLEGQIAGLACAGRDAAAHSLARRRERLASFVPLLEKTFALRPELKDLPLPGTLVCRCEDVPWSDITRYSTWRAAKLQTRCGMGPCQGRICGSALHFLLGWQQDSVRPPIFPVRMASLAGEEKREAETIAT